MFSKLCAALFFLVCLPGSVQAQEPVSPIKVVATFSILGDMIRTVGGNDVDVITLVGPDEDAHAFQPSPDAAKAIAQANIIAINGLHFEGWMNRLIKASGTKAKLLVVSAGVHPRLLEETTGERVPDPHAWQDLRNGQLYVKNIALALSEARPDQAAVFKQRAKAYIEKLATLDETARAAFDALPPTQRKLITSHDAFGYFAQAYGLTFLAPASMNTEEEPSAAAVAKLIAQINREKIKMIFIENMTDPRLIEQIAKDTGAHMGGTLYADALSKPEGEAPTYLDMMRVNIERITAALK